VAVPDRRPVRVVLPHRRPDRQSGWWASLFTAGAERRRSAPPGAEEQVDGEFVITGNLFEDGNVTISRSPGASSRAIDAYEPARWPIWAMASA
jgi:hypothetical protein